MKKILIHGSGHKAASWNETISRLECGNDILCPNLAEILNGEDASYANLYSAFARYCGGIDGRLDLCGISLGGILALNYAIDFPDKVNTLVLIGTPHKTPKLMLSIQNVVFRLLPRSCFDKMEFSKAAVFVLGSSMKNLNFSDKVHNIACPTLIICGEKDRANIKSAYFLSDNIKNAKLRIIERTGHVVNEEAPEVLAGLLNEFYKAH